MAELGITYTPRPGQEATGVYEAAEGVKVFLSDDPYLVGDGLQSPLPVKEAEGGDFFFDSQGNAQRALAIAPPLSPPANTAPPTISGDARVGQALTGTSGAWSGNPTPDLTYQWLAAGAAIAGAVQSSYTLTASELGKAISYRVTATNSQGSQSATSAATSPVEEALSPPANTALPTITGTPTAGQALTSATGTWTGNPAPTYARSWLRNGTVISGATDASYTLVAADVGANISVRVTATNIEGSAQATSTTVGPVAGIAPVNTVAPAVTGDTVVGATLICDDGEWSGVPTPAITRQWNADGVAIVGATAAEYELTAGEEGKEITVTVTAANIEGSQSATSAPTDPVIAE